VRVKGWVRRYDPREGGDLLPLGDAGPKTGYRVLDARGQEIAEGDVELDGHGGFDIRFTLPDTAHVGRAWVQFAGGHRHRFRIAEFRRPEFEVTVFPAGGGPQFAGGEVTVTAEANYFAGGALPGAPVRWTVKAQPGSFTPPNRGDYAFGEHVPAHHEQKRPPLPEGVHERFLEVRRALPEGAHLVYRPALGAEADLHYSRSSVGLEEWRRIGVTVPLVEHADGPDFDQLRTVPGGLGEGGLATGWTDARAPEAAFAACPSEVSDERRWKRWSRELESALYRERPATIWRTKRPALASALGETRQDFERRLAEALRAVLDEERTELERRYAPKLASQEDRIRRAEEAVAGQVQQLRSRQRRSWVDLGTSLLAAFFSRKPASSSNARRAGSAAKSLDRAAREREDVERAERELDAQRQKLRDLTSELDERRRALEEEARLERNEVEEVVVPPRKGDLDARELSLLWVPFGVGEGGEVEALA